MALILLLVKIPIFDDWAKKINPNAEYYISRFLILGTLYNYYLTVFSPYRMLEKLAKRKWIVLAERVAMLNSDYNGKFDFSCNIMIPRRRFFYRIEPTSNGSNKQRLTIWGDVFKVIWKSENAHFPQDLKITINQGVCGQAFRDASATNPQNVKGAVLTPEKLKNYNFNFTKKQLELTANLRIVASCPLVINEKGIKNEKNKVIGVLNIECIIEGSEKLIEDHASRKDFYVKLAKLSNLYLNLHV